MQKSGVLKKLKKEDSNIWENHLPSPTMPRTSNLFITSPRVRAPPAGKKKQKKNRLWLREVTPAWSWGWWVELWSSGERSRVSDHIPSSAPFHFPVSLGRPRTSDVPSVFYKFTASIRINWLRRVFSPCCAQPRLEKKHTNHTQDSVMWFAVRGSSLALLDWQQHVPLLRRVTNQDVERHKVAFPGGQV